MSWLQATVVLVTHVVERPLYIFGTAAVVVLCFSNTTGNTLTSYTLTISLLLTVSACGLVCNEGLSYIAVLRARTSRHDCVHLPDYCLSVGTGDVILVHYRTLFELVVCGERFYDL